MTGSAPTILETLTIMGAGVLMVLSGLGKRRLERRPVPRTPATRTHVTRMPRLNRFRRKR